MIWLAKLLIARNPAMTLDHAKRLVKIGLLVALLLAAGGVGLWLYLSGRSDGAAKERLGQARAATEAVTTARKADGAAQTTVDAGNDAVAAENDAARKAAAESNDPLAAAMQSLREGGGQN